MDETPGMLNWRRAVEASARFQIEEAEAVAAAAEARFAALERALARILEAQAESYARGYREALEHRAKEDRDA